MKSQQIAARLQPHKAAFPYKKIRPHGKFIFELGMHILNIEA